MSTQIQKQIEEVVIPDRFRTIQTWNGEIFQWVIAYLKKPNETSLEVLAVALEMMERIEAIVEKHLEIIATKSAEVEQESRLLLESSVMQGTRLALDYLDIGNTEKAIKMIKIIRKHIEKKQNLSQKEEQQ